MRRRVVGFYLYGSSEQIGSPAKILNLGGSERRVEQVIEGIWESGLRPCTHLAFPQLPMTTSMTLISAAPILSVDHPQRRGRSTIAFHREHKFT
jgi:hypothetical protein